jgi:hypothetical protein
MTPADLIAAGQTLYGAVWQSALARMLRNGNGDPLSDRTVRLWIEGKRTISPWADQQILDLLVDAQETRIAALIPTLSPHPAEITLTAYDSPGDLRKITGDGWTADFHSRMVHALADRLRTLGLTVHVTVVKPAAYFKWLGKDENTGARRSEFAARDR